MDTENCHVCNADTPYPSVSAESVPSLIDNLTYALYGLITKTVVSGRVNWTIPCDPNSNASIWGYTRNAGEGLMCYFLRVFQNTNPGVWPDGIAGQFLTSLGGGNVAWANTVVTTATTSLLGGFKLASSGSDVSISTASILALSTTGVAAGTFGSPTQWPVITVDTKGRLTGASIQSIAITSAQISGISASQVGTGLTSAQISGLSAAQIGAGLTSAQITGISASQVGSGLTSAQINSISSSALPLSGATAATYGSAGTHPVLAINANGIITGATNQLISIGASQVLAGLTSAQIVGLSAAQIGTGITSAQIAGLSAAQVGTGLTSAQITGINVTQVGSLGANVSTFLQTPTSANLISAVTDETGTGTIVFSTSPAITTPTLTTPAINGYSEGVTTAGPLSSAYTFAITTSTVFVLTLGSNVPCTFTMPTAAANKSFALYLKQPSSGTPTTAAFSLPSPVVWAAAVAPTITPTLGRMDVFSFFSDGTKWFGNYIQNFIY